jgi:hypothetical protein
MDMEVAQLAQAAAAFAERRMNAEISKALEGKKVDNFSK